MGVAVKSNQAGLVPHEGHRIRIGIPGQPRPSEGPHSTLCSGRLYPNSARQPLSDSDPVSTARRSDEVQNATPPSLLQETQRRTRCHGDDRAGETNRSPRGASQGSQGSRAPSAPPRVMRWPCVEVSTILPDLSCRGAAPDTTPPPTPVPQRPPRCRRLSVAWTPQTSRAPSASAGAARPRCGFWQQDLGLFCSERSRTRRRARRLPPWNLPVTSVSITRHRQEAPVLPQPPNCDSSFTLQLEIRVQSRMYLK